MKRLVLLFRISRQEKGISLVEEGPTADDFDHEVTPHLFDKAEAYAEMNEKINPFLVLAFTLSPYPNLAHRGMEGKSGLNPYADFVMQIDHRMGKLNGLLDELGIQRILLSFLPVITDAL